MESQTDLDDGFRDNLIPVTQWLVELHEALELDRQLIELASR
jgi:hypothetical protein